MPAIASRVQRRGGLGDVLADDRDVADLLVALAELVVRQADRSRIVRDLRLFQRAAMQRDRTRLIAARRSHPPVQAPQSGQPAGRHGLAERVGRAAKRRGRLVEIVLKQPRFGERGAHG